MAQSTDPVRAYEARSRTREPFPVKSGMEVRVHMKVREGDKERVQVFEGMVVALHGGGAGRTFTVRRVVGGIGLERTFPMFSPRITDVEITGATRVRRAKLTYLRKSNVKRRMKDDQAVLERAIAARDEQRRAALAARREAEEAERAAKEAAKKAEEEAKKEKEQDASEDTPPEEKTAQVAGNEKKNATAKGEA